MKAYILLFLLVALTLTQNCPGFNANDLIQSGILQSYARKTCV